MNLPKPGLCYEKDELMRLSKSPLCKQAPINWHKIVGDMPFIAKKPEASSKHFLREMEGIRRQEVTTSPLRKMWFRITTMNIFELIKKITIQILKTSWDKSPWIVSYSSRKWLYSKHFFTYTLKSYCTTAHLKLKRYSNYKSVHK